MLLVLACARVFVLFVGVCIIYFVFCHITKSLKRAGSCPRVVRFVGFGYCLRNCSHLRQDAPLTKV